MNYRIILRRKPENQIAEIFDWYEKQRAFLGHEFLLSIDASLRIIENNPLIYQKRINISAAEQRSI